MATDVVSGERADDGLYVPIIDRVVSTLEAIGTVVRGRLQDECLGNPCSYSCLGSTTLTPLAMVGDTAQEMETWIQEGLDGDACADADLCA